MSIIFFFLLHSKPYVFTRCTQPASKSVKRTLFFFPNKYTTKAVECITFETSLLWIDLYTFCEKIISNRLYGCI
jgi:hypothetical protein